MHPTLTTVILLLTVATALPAMTEEQSKTVFPALQAAAARLPLLAISDVDGKRFASITLNRQPVTADGARVDAVRLRVPAGGGDLVWAFAIPRHCSSWYIIPASGSGPGFTDFLRGRHWRESTWPSDPSYRPFLQTLSAAHLTPGADYLIWFEFTGEMPAVVHLAARFAPAPATEWDGEAIERLLGLTEAELDLRAERFATRGGTLLRNEALVGQPFGAFRLHSLLNLIDRTPIAITTAPGRLPSLAEVAKLLGKPDLVLEHDALLAAGMTSLGDGDAVQGTSVGLVRGKRSAMYDHVVLTAADEAAPVAALDVLAWDASTTAAHVGGEALDHLSGGWTLVHRDGRLLAVLRDLGGGAGAVAHGAVPAGTWRGRSDAGWIDEEVQVDAVGTGTRMLFNHPGMRSQVFALRTWRYQGEATAYHDPTRKRAVVHYRDGQLDGEAVWYELDGTEAARATYRQGKRLPAPAKPKSQP
jgi:hypothetical protein